MPPSAGHRRTVTAQRPSSAVPRSAPPSARQASGGKRRRSSSSELTSTRTSSGTERPPHSGRAGGPSAEAAARSQSRSDGTGVPALPAQHHHPLHAPGLSLEERRDLLEGVAPHQAG